MPYTLFKRWLRIEQLDNNKPRFVKLGTNFKYTCFEVKQTRCYPRHNVICYENIVVLIVCFNNCLNSLAVHGLIRHMKIKTLEW